MLKVLKCCVLCCTLILISLLSPVVRADFSITNDLELINNEAAGPGAANSIFDRGFSYSGSLNLTSRAELEGYDFLFNLGVKTQEESRIEQQVVLFSRLKASFTNRDNASVITIGDTFEYFDQYVLNSSLKGLSYRYLPAPESTLTLVFGYDYPRWENFYSDDYQAVARRSLGINLQNNLQENFKWGLSLLNTDDQKGVEEDDVLYQNNLYGINWEYIPLPGLTVRGSSAYGSTEESGGSSYAGTAHKITVFSNASEGRASIDYERVEPNFKTLLGSATTDTEKYKASLLYRYSKTINYNFDYVYYHDNLAGQKENTTYYHKPGIGVSLKRLFNRRYASAGLKYNLNQKNSTARTITDNIVSLNYRDRFTITDRTPVDAAVNVNYGRENSVNGADTGQENELTYNLSLSTRKRMENYVLRPVLRFGYFRNDDRDEDSAWSFEKSLELGLDIPESKINSSIRLGQRDSFRDDAENNNKFFADLSLYCRPDFLEDYGRGRIFLKLKYNDLNYSESTDRDLRENSIMLGVNFGI